MSEPVYCRKCDECDGSVYLTPVFCDGGCGKVIEDVIKCDECGKGYVNTFKNSCNC